jgi:hypothetical protein
LGSILFVFCCSWYFLEAGSRSEDEETDVGEIDTEDEDDSMADDDLELILLSLLVSKSTLVSIGRFSRFAFDSWLLAFFFSSLFKSSF